MEIVSHLVYLNVPVVYFLVFVGWRFFGRYITLFLIERLNVYKMMLLLF